MKNITLLFIAMLLPLGLPLGSSAYVCGTPELTAGWKTGSEEGWNEVPSAPELPAAPALPVGTERTFFAPDFRSMQQYRVSTVLRGVGNFCYVFVEDTEWNTRVTAATVQAIIRAFDAAVPMNPQRGIYLTLTEIFGAPPDIDRNGRIILLLLNIRDKDNGNQYTAGFFNPADQSRGVLRHPGFRGFPIRSNEGEILYIDTHPLNPNSETAHNVVAHEFQHIINWTHDAKEATWVDEGCAEYASFLCGYSLQEHITAFEKAPTISLVTWPDAGGNLLPHYGAAFLWMLYLHEQYGGIATVTEIVQNRGTSFTGIADVLASQGVHQTVSDIFISWKLANYLSDYRAVNLSLSPRRWHRSYPSGTQDGELGNFSADYIGFENAGGLTIGFSSGSVSNTAVHAIEFHTTGAVEVREMALSTSNTGSLVLPTTVTEAVLVPSLQRDTPSFHSENKKYQYSGTRGAHIAFTTTALPNAVHPRYWDIIAKPSEPLVGLTPMVTLMLHNNKAEQLYREAQAMYQVTRDAQDNHLYRFSFLLEPEIEPESIRYQISLDSRIVDTGTLTE
ncbi:MAG: hypothetical protein OXN25_01955 [Candidatus Poribacteria bacterium]|nr:hypothetical protein [Candidatus Poribacteria bacterium]